MDVAVLVFTGVTSAEVLGPLAAMELADPNIRWHGLTVGTTVAGFEPFHRFAVSHDVDDVGAADVLLVAGGLGSVRMMSDGRVVRWLRATADMSRYVLAVSTGSLLLAAAGLLEGEDASGHWLATDVLADTGALPSGDAVTRRGRIITTTGSTAAAEVARGLPERVRFGPPAA